MFAETITNKLNEMKNKNIKRIVSKGFLVAGLGLIMNMGDVSAQTQFDKIEVGGNMTPTGPIYTKIGYNTISTVRQGSFRHTFLNVNEGDADRVWIGNMNEGKHKCDLHVSGKTGLGTYIPTTQLHVKANHSDRQLTLGRDGYRSELGSSSTGLGFRGTIYEDRWKWDLFIERETGVVGIGTTSLNTNYPLTIKNNNNTSNGSIRLENGGNIGFLNLEKDGDLHFGTIGDGSNEGAIIFSNGAGGMGTEQMKIAENGQVRVGSNNNIAQTAEFEVYNHADDDRSVTLKVLSSYATNGLDIKMGANDRNAGLSAAHAEIMNNENGYLYLGTKGQKVIELNDNAQTRLLGNLVVHGPITSGLVNGIDIVSLAADVDAIDGSKWALQSQGIATSKNIGVGIAAASVVDGAKMNVKSVGDRPLMSFFHVAESLTEEEMQEMSSLDIAMANIANQERALNFWNLKVDNSNNLSIKTGGKGINILSNGDIETGKINGIDITTLGVSDWKKSDGVLKPTEDIGIAAFGIEVKNGNDLTLSATNYDAGDIIFKKVNMFGITVETGRIWSKPTDDAHQALFLSNGGGTPDLSINKDNNVVVANDLYVTGEINGGLAINGGISLIKNEDGHGKVTSTGDLLLKAASNEDIKLVIGNNKIAQFKSNGNFYLDGNMECEQLKVVEVGLWKDEVFEDDYALQSLEEVESFIDINGHLPEVPSETEVKANGYDIAEMDAILLGKIEELTLHMIELQKVNKAQSQLIENLIK